MTTTPRTTILLIMLAVLVGVRSASGQWVVQFESRGDSQGIAVAADDEGNTYVVGSFNYDSDFDPTDGVALLVNAGDTDLFVAKYDVSGSYVWAFDVGSTLHDEANAVAVDDSGNLYVAGRFNGTVDFDPSAGIAELVSEGSGNAFLAKYDSNGNYLWAFGIGAESFDRVLALALDDNGGAYLTGEFDGIVDFDPGTSVAELESAGLYDAFVAKYSADGQYEWAFKLGSSATSKFYGGGIAVDSGGNVYVTGYFSGLGDFDPGVGTAEIAGAGFFVAKYDAEGQLQWAFRVGNLESDEGHDIAIDPHGNVYVTGTFFGSVDFDPGPGVASLSSEAFDAFLASYAPDGSYRWALNVGDRVAWDMSYDVTVDNSSDVYIAGQFTNIADFDPGDDLAELRSVGDEDVFVAKYSAEGRYEWAFNIGWPSETYSVRNKGYGIAADGLGNLFVTGVFSAGADFDPGPGTLFRSTLGTFNGFLARYPAKDPLHVSLQSPEPIVQSFSELYPNPFSTETSFEFSVSEAQHVRVEMLDVLGRPVARLFQDLVVPDHRNRIRIDGTSLPAGIYIVRVLGRSLDISRTAVLQRQ